MNWKSLSEKTPDGAVRLEIERSIVGIESSANWFWIKVRSVREDREINGEAREVGADERIKFEEK